MTAIFTIAAAAVVAGTSFFAFRKALQNRRIYNFHNED